MAGVRDNIAAPRLGDDIRLPYTFGAIGMVTLAVSLGIYATTSFHSTLGSLGGWMTGVFAVTCSVMLVVYWRRIRQYSRTFSAIVDEAVATVIQRGGHVAQ